MSNDYLTTLMVNQRIADLRHEADEARLARIARPRGARPHGAPRRWWERLMLSRTHSRYGGSAAPRPVATVAGSDSPC